MVTDGVFRKRLHGSPRVDRADQPTAGEELCPPRAPRDRQVDLAAGCSSRGALHRSARLGPLPPIQSQPVGSAGSGGAASAWVVGGDRRDPASPDAAQRSPSNLRIGPRDPFRAVRIERQEAPPGGGESARWQSPAGMDVSVSLPGIRAKLDDRRGVRVGHPAAGRQRPATPSANAGGLRRDVHPRGDPGRGARSQSRPFRPRASDRRALQRPDPQHRESGPRIGRQAVNRRALLPDPRRHPPGHEGPRDQAGDPHQGNPPSEVFPLRHRRRPGRGRIDGRCPRPGVEGIRVRSTHPS